MDYNNKKVIVSAIYCSPSQNNEEFDSFLTNFQKLLNKISSHKPSLFIIACDFNARFHHWWFKDIHITEGSKILLETS